MTQTQLEIPTSPLRMSFEEFLEWGDEDTHAEWVDGEVIFLCAVTRQHLDLGDMLTALLRFYVEHRDLGKVFSSPALMKTGARLSGREPDVLFLLNEHLDRFRKTYIDGPADLVVEIVSPESVARDCVDKYREYEQGGVQEYWILDPDQKSGEFYGLGEDGKYQVIPLEGGIFRSRVLDGLWLKDEWLWREPLPPLREVLKEWDIL